MKKFNFLSLGLVFLLTAASFLQAAAQTDNALAPDTAGQSPKPGNRPDLLRELGLSTDQRQQIRLLNLEKRQLAQDVRARLDEANRNLDQAIYADNINQSEIQTRIREVHAAQSELLKLRATNELAVRRILTNEQLVKFRILREQFERSLPGIERFPNESNRVPNRKLKIGARQLRRKIR